jgi:hypothetical protein
VEGNFTFPNPDRYYVRLFIVISDALVLAPKSPAAWIQTYAEVARERREAYARLDREVGLLRSMLMISFQVRLAFDVGTTSLPLEDQANLVAHLHDSITTGGEHGMPTLSLLAPAS